MYTNTPKQIQNESELQIMLYQNVKIVAFKKSLANVFNKGAVEQRCAQAQLTAGSNVSFGQTDDWTMLALLFLADDLGFGTSLKPQNNPKLSPDCRTFNYDKKMIASTSVYKSTYDIVSNTATTEAPSGISVNQLYYPFEEANANNNKSFNVLAKQWYDKVGVFPLFCGPSSRGAKVYYAMTTQLISSTLLNKGAVLGKTLNDQLGGSIHPLIPVFAMLSLLTGKYGHHSFYEVFSGLVGYYPTLTLDNLSINLLKVLGTYSAPLDMVSVDSINTAALAPTILNNDLLNLIKNYSSK